MRMTPDRLNVIPRMHSRCEANEVIHVELQNRRSHIVRTTNRLLYAVAHCFRICVTITIDEMAESEVKMQSRISELHPVLWYLG